MKKTVVVLLLVLCSMGASASVGGVKAMVFDEAETKVSVSVFDQHLTDETGAVLTPPLVIEKQVNKQDSIGNISYYVDNHTQKEYTENISIEYVRLPQTGDNNGIFSIIGWGIVILGAYCSKKYNQREGI
ncbi:LPXTG cell wall anchor domain-containing protein [Brochothrix campestris]